MTSEWMVVIKENMFGIIGCGNMAEALVSGILENKVFGKKQIVGYDVREAQVKTFTKKFGIQKGLSVEDVVGRTRVCLLAVKPQQMASLLDAIKPAITKQHVVISIAAGLDLKFFERLGKDKKIIRVMPNTPALIGMGASVYCLNKNCGQAERKLAKKLFASIGIAIEVKKESLLDAVTALSGSGPAFVYSFIEGLMAGAQKMGLPHDLALDLTLQTLIGSALLFKDSGLQAFELIAKVASKGGTTEAGLKILNKNGFQKTLIECIQAATERAKDLKCPS